MATPLSPPLILFQLVVSLHKDFVRQVLCVHINRKVITKTSDAVHNGGTVNTSQPDLMIRHS